MRIEVAPPPPLTPYLAPPSPERRPVLAAAGVSPLGSAFSLSFSGVSAISELAIKMPESWRAMLIPYDSPKRRRACKTCSWPLIFHCTRQLHP